MKKSILKALITILVFGCVGQVTGDQISNILRVRRAASNARVRNEFVMTQKYSN